MMRSVRYLRYETILEMLEDGPVPLNEIIENLEDFYHETEISGVLQQMQKKEYIEISENSVQKKKDLFYNEL